VEDFICGQFAYDVVKSEVYIGPSQVFTGGQDLTDAILLWALVFCFF
jgi:hypothetical protein